VLDNLGGMVTVVAIVVIVLRGRACAIERTDDSDSYPTMA
jgi:hypothetical protein